MKCSTDYIQLLWDRLAEQEHVYRAVLAGDRASVCHAPYQDSTYGTQDANYRSRMRLAYYLLYAGIREEEPIHFLFREELKDRQTNGFQGIGHALNVLTVLLRCHNADGKYDALFQKAKMANFDCAAGYDTAVEIDPELNGCDLLDCIYLAQDLDYPDVMGTLVDLWKPTISQWTDSSRNMLLRFNTTLGREAENEAIHKQILASSLSGTTFHIASAYKGLIEFYIDQKNYTSAEQYLTELTSHYPLSAVRNLRLFAYFLEYALEIIANVPTSVPRLWPWAKAELKRTTHKFGNLYIKAIAAAKAAKDPYALKLEAEYLLWQKRFKIK